MKRIPLPLALAFAIEALLALATPFGLDARAFRQVDLVGGLAADALAAVGLIWLARRAERGPIATGATIAGAAWCARFLLGLAFVALRPSTQLAWLGAMVTLLVAAGFATMASQRSRPLAAAAVVTGAAASSLAFLVLGSASRCGSPAPGSRTSPCWR